MNCYPGYSMQLEGIWCGPRVLPVLRDGIVEKKCPCQQPQLQRPLYVYRLRHARIERYLVKQSSRNLMCCKRYTSYTYVRYMRTIVATAAILNSPRLSLVLVNLEVFARVLGSPSETGNDLDGLDPIFAVKT